jgi:hypothetical protein
MVTSSNPLDALDAQNLEALQESLNTMQSAQSDGVQGLNGKIASAQSAIAGYGATPDVVGSGSGAIAQSTNSGIISSVTGAASDLAKGALSAATGGVSSGLSDILFSSRWIVLVVGVLLIAAGLFTFRTTQTVIETGTRTVKKGATIAAETTT